MDKIDISWYSASEAAFTIKTAKELAGLSQLVNDGNDFSGKTINLGADIVLNDTENWTSWKHTTTGLNPWIPIGNSDDKPFRGAFDGDGHTISGIYISTWDKFQGLFGVNRGVIKRLGVLASYVKGNYDTGCLTGQNNGEISNCYAMGNVGGVERTGGLAGQNSGIIRYSYATGNVSANGKHLGGLAGENSGEICNCYAIGNMSSLDGTVVGGYSGGLVGENSGKISNCYAKGNVSFNHNGPAGGLAGRNIKGSISNCYATGSVYSMAFVNGGLVGVSEGGTVSNSYYNIQASGQSDKGKGDGKTTEEMLAKSTYEGWDFNSIWVMHPGNYPSFKLHRKQPSEQDLSKPTKEFELEQFAKGNLIAWNVATNCEYTPTIELMDGDKKLFSFTKNEGSHFQFLGNGSAMLENTAGLKLKVSIPQSSNIKSSIVSGAILNENAKRVGYVYNICIEDFSDDDYNDVYVNIIGWLTPHYT
jgi:hypothetical protein